MMKVLKWSVPVDDAHHVIGNGPVLHVGCQSGFDTVQVWTLENCMEDGTISSQPNTKVQVFGTGQAIPDERFPQPLGSVIVLDGQIVWHLLKVY